MNYNTDVLRLDKQVHGTSLLARDFDGMAIDPGKYTGYKYPPMKCFTFSIVSHPSLTQLYAEWSHKASERERVRDNLPQLRSAFLLL